jgi:hypothetical protein
MRDLHEFPARFAHQWVILMAGFDGACSGRSGSTNAPKALNGDGIMKRDLSAA